MAILSYSQKLSLLNEIIYYWLLLIDENTNKGRNKSWKMWTVENASKYTVWIKPEDNSLPPIPLAPNSYYYDNIDGVTLPSPEHYGQVFKTLTGFERMFGIYIDNDGVYVGVNNILYPLPQEANNSRGGWLTSPPDPEWNSIFEKAGYIFR